MVHVITDWNKRYDHRKPPAPAEKSKPRLTKQRAERLSKDEIYGGLKTIYLHENPNCVRCGNRAKFIHHVVRGTGGRARSLLNSDTWLGVCSDKCHDEVEKMPVEKQIKLKQRKIKETVERLRK